MGILNTRLMTRKGSAFLIENCYSHFKLILNDICYYTISKAIVITVLGKENQSSALSHFRDG